MTIPNVTFMRPELRNLLPQYDLIRDCLAGEPTIKAKKELYLPKPSIGDPKNEVAAKANRERYDAYIKRAVFYNVTRRTLSGLVGQAFVTDPVIEVPPLMDTLIMDATGTGVSAVQVAKKALSLTMAYSRSGLLVDYPMVDGTATVQQIESGEIRPTINVYSPQEIINWRVIERGARELLSLIVLAETYTTADDGFEMKNSLQFRVLKLDEAGLYVQEIWREDVPTEFKGGKYPTSNTYYKPHIVITPTDYRGERLDYIPFTFIGSENNDSSPDAPNLYDMASLNVAHYRNSADYEEACFIMGQPTVVVTGVDGEWVKNVLQGAMNFGSRGGIPLPENADAKLLQAEPNMMIKEAMDTKERQMVALGAKLVEQKEVQRTATETKLEATSDGSVLSSTTKNVNTAFQWALEVASIFMFESEQPIKFELNTDFDITDMTTEEQNAVLLQWQKGAITFTEMRAKLRKAGTATEDDDKAKADIEADTAKAMAMEAVANESGVPTNKDE